MGRLPRARAMGWAHVRRLQPQWHRPAPAVQRVGGTAESIAQASAVGWGTGCHGAPRQTQPQRVAAAAESRAQASAVGWGTGRHGSPRQTQLQRTADAYATDAGNAERAPVGSGPRTTAVHGL